ncbi:hypothetical protein ACLMAB_08580 [Brevibacillus laterosporus]
MERQQLIEAITNEVITRLDTLRLQKSLKYSFSLRMKANGLR